MPVHVPTRRCISSASLFPAITGGNRMNSVPPFPGDTVSQRTPCAMGMSMETSNPSLSVVKLQGPRLVIYKYGTLPIIMIQLHVESLRCWARHAH